MSCNHNQFHAETNMFRYNKFQSKDIPPDMLIAQLQAKCVECGEPVLWMNQHVAPDEIRPYANCSSADRTKVWIQCEIPLVGLVIPERKIIT